jgi:hypothetical protein
VIGAAVDDDSETAVASHGVDDADRQLLCFEETRLLDVQL